MPLGRQWYTWTMKLPLVVRPVTDDAPMLLATARRTADAFRVRRAQIVLASTRGLSPKPIAELVGCSVQTVRHVIQAFNAQGVKGLVPPANRPKTVKPSLDVARCDRLQPLLQQSPRPYGKSTGVWTLALAAAVCDEPGVTERLRREETIRRALNRLGTTWKRAKPWITSPDPPYARKKSGAIA
jgi:transposase